MPVLPVGHLRCFPLEVGRADISFANGFGEDRDGRAHHAIDIWLHPRIPIAVMSPVYAFPLVSRVFIDRRQGNRRETIDGIGHTLNSGNYVYLLDSAGYIHYFAHLGQRSTLTPGGPAVSPGATIGVFGGHGLHYQVFGPVDTGSEEFRTRVLTTIYASVNPYEELRRLAQQYGGTALGNAEGTYRIPASAQIPLPAPW